MTSFKTFIASVRAKSGRQLIFLSIAITLSLALLGFSVYASMFLSRHLRNALSSDINKPVPVEQFDIAGFEKLNLIKK